MPQAGDGRKEPAKGKRTNSVLGAENWVVRKSLSWILCPVMQLEAITFGVSKEMYGNNKLFLTLQQRGEEKAWVPQVRQMKLQGSVGARNPQWPDEGKSIYSPPSTVQPWIVGRRCI